MRIASVGRRAACALSLAIAMPACGVGGIDTSLISPISNNDTFTVLSNMWAGARSAIGSKREPGTGAFNLALTSQLPCSRGGQGSYQGTVSGTKAANGTGTGVLSLTANLSACQFDDNVKITTITASGFTVIGTIALVNDTWGDINIRMVATTVTVNGLACPGGIDVQITATTPFAQATSTGTACGRTGAVTLP